MFGGRPTSRARSNSFDEMVDCSSIDSPLLVRYVFAYHLTPTSITKYFQCTGFRPLLLPLEPYPFLPMSKQKKATIYALTTVAVWSTVASAFKLSLARMDHVHLLFFSSLTASMCLGAILIIQKKERVLFRTETK